jgi:hypothetical protein
MYGNISMIKLECYLRYCIDQHCFCKDYNYIKISFSSTHINDCKFLFGHESTLNVGWPSM